MVGQCVKRHPGVIKLGTGRLVRKLDANLIAFPISDFETHSSTVEGLQVLVLGGYRLLTRFAGELSKIERQNHII